MPDCHLAPRCRTLLFALGAVTALHACGGDAGQVSLLPASVIVMDGDLDLAEGPVLASTRSLFGVITAVRDGARILVLTSRGRTALMTWHPPVAGCSTCGGTVGSAGGGSTGYDLFVSEDEGASWRDLPLALSPGASEILGMAAWGGRVLIIDYRFEVSGGLSNRAFYRLREIDPTTGVTQSNGAIDGHEFLALSPFLAAGSRLTFFTFSQNLTEDVGHYEAVRYDFADDTLVQVSGGEVAFAGGAMSSPMRQTSFQTAWHTLDGEVFSGLARSADLRYAAGSIYPRLGTTGMCWRKGMFGDPPTSVATDCLDLSVLPPEMRDPIGPARTASGLVALSSFEGKGFALPLSEPFSADRLIALGDGVPLADADTHPRWGRLVRLGDRFVDLPASGPPEEVLLHLTPCVDPAACGDTPELQASLALDDGAMLNVYVLDRHEGPGEAYALVVRRERPPRQAFTAAVSVPVPGRLAFYPKASPASALEQACLLAVSCLEGPDVYGECGRVWRELPPGNQARQAFLRAGSCAAVRAAWPDAALVGTPGCAPTCVGNVLITRCASDGTTNSVVSAEDCARGGARCEDFQPDGQPYHLGCFVGDAVSTSATAVCDGDVLRRAKFVPNGLGYEYQRDCAAEGLVCLSSGAGAFCAAPCTGPLRCEEGLGYKCLDLNGDGVLDGGVIDCAAEGGLCRAVEGPIDEIYCDSPAPNDDCSGSFLGAAWAVPTAVPEATRHCLGHYLAWCADKDQLSFIDCAALGAGGCSTDHYGSRCQ